MNTGKLVRVKSGGYRLNSRDIGVSAHFGDLNRGTRRSGGQTRLKRSGQKFARRVLRGLTDEMVVEALGEREVDVSFDPLESFRKGVEEVLDRALAETKGKTRQGFALWVTAFDYNRCLGVYMDEVDAEMALVLEKARLTREGHFDSMYDRIWLAEMPVFEGSS